MIYGNRPWEKYAEFVEVIFFIECTVTRQ